MRKTPPVLGNPVDFIMNFELHKQGEADIESQYLTLSDSLIQPIKCPSDKEDDCWGGMDRKEIHSGKEDDPKFVAVDSPYTTDFGKHTGLVFLVQQFKPYCAYFYAGGERVRLVMLFDDALRVEIGKDGRVSHWSSYSPQDTEYYKRLSSDELPEKWNKEQAYKYISKSEFYYLQRCFFQYIFDFATPFDCLLIIVTIQLMMFIIIHKIYRFPYFWPFSVLCMFLLLVTTTLSIYVKSSSITYRLLSLFISLVGYSYYVDSLFNRAMRAVFFISFSIQLLKLRFDERISAIAVLYSVISFVAAHFI